MSLYSPQVILQQALEALKRYDKTKQETSEALASLRRQLVRWLRTQPVPEKAYKFLYSQELTILWFTWPDEALNHLLEEALESSTLTIDPDAEQTGDPSDF